MPHLHSQPTTADDFEAALGFWENVISECEGARFVDSTPARLRRPDGPPYYELDDDRRGYTRRDLFAWRQQRRRPLATAEIDTAA